MIIMSILSITIVSYLITGYVAGRRAWTIMTIYNKLLKSNLAELERKKVFNRVLLMKEEVELLELTESVKKAELLLGEASSKRNMIVSHVFKWPVILIREVKGGF